MCVIALLGAGVVRRQRDGTCVPLLLVPLQKYEGHQNFSFEDKFVQLEELGEGSFNVVHKVRSHPWKWMWMWVWV